MSANRKFFTWLVLGGCAFILSRGIIDMFLIRGDSLTAGNPVTRLILAVSYSSVAIILIQYGREARFLLRRNWVLVALVLLPFVSSLWVEQTPGLVLQRSVGVLGTTLLGIALATRLSLEEQLRLMRWVFRIMGVLSLACVLLFPGYGISHSLESQGEWQGIFGYKNGLGAMMAMSILVEWHLPAETRFSKFTKIGALSISAVLLVFSNSVTPLVCLTATLLFIEIYGFAKQRLRIPLYAIILAILLIVASGLTVFFVDSDSVTGILGRSSNLTGRTAIWSFVLSFISNRPVLGYGYSGFWYGSSPESSAVDQALGQPIMYSHNGYLEMLLGLGAVGLLLALAFLGTGMVRAYYCFEKGRSKVNLWPLAFLCFFLLYNIGECTILMQDLQWALCVAVIASADAALVAREGEQEVEQEAEQVGQESLYSPVQEAT